MKALITYLILISLVFQGNSQTWQSINYSQFSNTVPWGQFTINQYTNDIWMVNDNKVSILENSGVKQLFDYTDLGTLWTGDELKFTFTPDSVFYMKKVYGLFNFNNYVSTQILIETDITDITSTNDTVYISRMGTGLKYAGGNVVDTYFSAADVSIKNEFLYTDNGVLGYEVAYSNVMLWSDPEYLFASMNCKKFQRHTDTIFAGTTKGIMYAFNYDVLDTITPNNTSNMPSANILEIEFDHQDSLWAVFGDVNDVPFAIAKLEGSIWTNVFNTSNSPIDFSNFLGLEIDTLGNLWVADNMALHTILTPNSPTWLGLNDYHLPQNFNVYPNPSSETFSIQNLNEFDLIKVVDLQGRVVIETNEKYNIDISSIHCGNYIVQVFMNGQSYNLTFIKN
jgi:hypothetical protein